MISYLFSMQYVYGKRRYEVVFLQVEEILMYVYVCLTYRLINISYEYDYLYIESLIYINITD